MTGKTPADGLVNIISFDLGITTLLMLRTISSHPFSLACKVVTQNAKLISQGFQVVIVDERYNSIVCVVTDGLFNQPQPEKF